MKDNNEKKNKVLAQLIGVCYHEPKLDESLNLYICIHCRALGGSPNSIYFEQPNFDNDWKLYGKLVEFVKEQTWKLEFMDVMLYHLMEPLSMTDLELYSNELYEFVLNEGIIKEIL